MIIIGGAFKGVKLYEAFDKNTRPLKDLVKESILNILNYSNNEKTNLENSTVLDLFSGTGSFGLECVSRGAKKVYFCENYIKSLEILEKNVKKLKCQKKVKIFNKSAHALFENKELKNEAFDLIFLDPPFKEGLINSILKHIVKLNILKKNGIIVLHRHKKTKEDFCKEFVISRSEKYGISKIMFGKIN
tara:strand:+ start:111 stop:677 length:567 start_codon:yes stop_codon:yes gene_type:complete